MQKLFLRLLLDASIVAGTIVLSLGGLAFVSYVAILLHLPTPLTEFIGCVSFVMLLATPYWIYRFSKGQPLNESESDARTIKKFARTFTWISVIGILVIDILAHGRALAPTTIIIIGSFIVPLIFLYRNHLKSKQDQDERPH